MAQSCVTPCTFEVSRKAEFIVKLEADGYKTQEIPVKTQLAGGGAAGFAGNILLGGVVGMAVDAGTGSTLEHVPNPVHAALEPLGSQAKQHGLRYRSPGLRVVPIRPSAGELTQ